MTAREHDPALVEALFAWWMDYDEGQANFQDLPKVVEGLIAAERERVLARVHRAITNMGTTNAEAIRQIVVILEQEQAS